MVERKALEQYLAKLLAVADFKDYCPNGLQIEGKDKISKIVTGVSISQALIDEAIKINADAILVHHGMFFKGETEVITGIKQKRIKQLLVHDINLFGFHLPLDCHPELGNNAQLAKLLNFNTLKSLTTYDGYALGSIGTLQTPMTVKALSEHIANVLKRAPLCISSTLDKQIKTIAWCTGAAQAFIEQAQEQGVDAYLSGEIYERTVLFARETDIVYFAAGHHATERYGIKALGEHLAAQFNLEHTFIDLENPV